MRALTFLSPLMFSSLFSFFAHGSPLIASTEQPDDGPVVRTLYEYPVGTWLENIAVRPSGELLITVFTKPQLVQFNPFETQSKPELIHTFPGYLAVAGIAEIAPDSFAVATGNTSFDSGPQKGSWSIWNVDFTEPHKLDATINKITDVPEATFIDGLCNLPSCKKPENILIGDIADGLIRRVDVTTGDSPIVIENKYTATAKDPLFGKTGVNGIHVKDDILYYVNSAKRTFASLPIGPNGNPTGPPTLIQKVHKSEEVFYFDDFAIKDDDAYLICGSANAIEQIGLDGTPKGKVIAGDLNSTQIAGPTAAAFGRTEKDSQCVVCGDLWSVGCSCRWGH